MTVVRRILIALVGLLLVLDAGALGIVKFASGPKPSAEKSKLVLWIDDKAQAEEAAEKLKEMGYEPLLKEGKRATFVDANFRVVMSASRKELLDPVAKVLAKSGHKNLSFNEDGTLLYYGGSYAKKSEAMRVAKSLKAKEMLVFEVEPGQKKVMKPSHRLILLEISDNMIDSATDPLRESVDIADEEIESLEPAEPEEDEVAEEDEEDEEE